MRLRARLALAAAALLAAALLFAQVLLALLGPFLVALFFAAIMDPVVDRLERLGLSRAAAALAVIGAVGSGVIGLAWLLLANLLQELDHLRAHLPDYSRSLEAGLQQWITWLSALVADVPHPFDDAIVSGAYRLTQLAADWVAGALARASDIPSMFLFALITLATVYFLCRDKRALGQFIMLLLPPRWRDEARRLKEEVTGGLLGFVRAQAILIAVSGTLSIAGLLLFNVRYAWSLGALAGILDIVPMVGPSGVFVPVIAWNAALGEWPRALGLGGVWLTILLVRQVIEPWIVGEQVGLHPVTTLMAMYIGGKLIGLNGVFLGPIVAITVKAICVVSVLPYLRQE